MGKHLPPSRATSAASIGELLSTILCPSGTAPGGSSSFPVTRIATCGWRTTESTLFPIDASRPTSCGRSSRPEGKTTLPFVTSSPTRPTCRPGVTASRAKTRAPPDSSSTDLGHQNCIGADRDRARGHDSDGFTRPNRSMERLCGHRGSDHGQRQRVVGFGAECVLAADCETVHCRGANAGTSTEETIALASTRPAAAASATDSLASRVERASSCRSTSATSARSRKPFMRTSWNGCGVLMASRSA